MAGMEAAQRVEPEADKGTTRDAARSAPGNGLVRVEPDAELIAALTRQAGATFKKCVQCGTCSGTCELSPADKPFPRKEMAWATWGLRDKLVRDVDIWLCHQCNDCSRVCPRGARPGDVLAAMRLECLRHYAFPRILARWAAHPRYLPLLLAIPALLLGLALAVSKPLGAALGMQRPIGQRIVYAYSSELPHWLLNVFFGTAALFVLLVLIVGVARFWAGMRAADRDQKPPVKGMVASVVGAIWRALTHENLASCGSTKPRAVSHFMVFFGFLALFVVSMSVVTAPYNPLFKDGFIYPFNFWSPFKLLANLGGAALIVGCVWMAAERLRARGDDSHNTYADWTLLWAVFLATISGFATELLHYLRLEPHRHAVYIAHLIFAFSLLVYLPYGKFGHMVYRTVAMVYAERTGRVLGLSAISQNQPIEITNDLSTDAGDVPTAEAERGTS